MTATYIKLHKNEKYNSLNFALILLEALERK